MAGVNEKISVVVDILGDISNFQNSIKTMQGELNKLNLSSGIKNSFASIFSELEREIGKIQTLGNKKKIDLIDSKALNKSFANVEALYSKLVNKIQSSGIKNSIFEKDAKAISAVESQLKSYEASIKKIGSSWSAAKGQVTRYTNELNKFQGKKESGLITIISDEEYQRAKTQIEALTEQKKKADANAKNAVKTGNTEAENEAIKEQLRLTTELEEANAALDGKMTQKQYEAELDKINTKLDEAQQKVKAFEQANDTNKASAWKELIAEISKIDNIDWSKFDIDLSKINNVNELKEALAQMKFVAASEAAPALEKVDNTIRNMGSSLDEGARKAQQTAQSLMELGDRQRDIQQLASRLTHFFSLTNQFMIMRRIIQNAITTIKELDKAMTETAVVTDFNVADMWAQLPEYTKVANELGATTKGAYETMTLFYQQGLNQQQAFQLGTETMKMARIAGLDYAEATDRMTNALRGFNMELNDVSSQRVNDVYSNLAAKSASNVDELSTAMTKTASIAHAANMEFETTAAFLAQIIETTRESAETAGTALKTVIARFSEVKKLYSEGELTGQDEEGEEIDVNRVSTALRAAGVDLNEYLTGAKGLDEVFIELASKWDNLDLITQRYIATMAAGSRQQSRFIALMQDYKRQTDLVSIAQNSAGASTQQFEKTLDSLEAKLNKLENAWNEFTMGIANSSMIKGAIDLITNLITAINKITSALGPVGGAITKVLLLFAGFKGVRVLFDKFVGHIAKVYIDIARKAGVAGMGAGEAFGKGFLGSSQNAFNKFSKIFSKSTWIQDNDIYKNAIRSVDKYQVALKALDAQKVVDADLNTAMIAEEEAKNAIKALGINNAVIEEGLLNGKITLDELELALTDESAMAHVREALAIKLENGELKKLTEEEVRNAATKVIQQKAQVGLLTKMGAYIKVLFSTSQATRLSALETLGLAKAQNGATVATNGLGKALAGLPFGWIIAAVAAIVVAIMAAVRSAEQMSISGKLDDIANLAESLEDRLKAVQERLDDFDEHVTNIETLKTDIEDAIVGTDAWKQKVHDLNEEYFKLADIIGADFWKHVKIENGQIIPDEGYLESANKDILNEQIRLQEEKIDVSTMEHELKIQDRAKTLFEKGNTLDFANVVQDYDENGTPILSELPDLVKLGQELSVEAKKSLLEAGSMDELNELLKEYFDGWYLSTIDDVEIAKDELFSFFGELDTLTAEIESTSQLAAANLQDRNLNAQAYAKSIQGAKDEFFDVVEEAGGELDQYMFNAGAPWIHSKINELNKNFRLGGRKLENMTDAFNEYVDIMNKAVGEDIYKVSDNGLDILEKADGEWKNTDLDPSEVLQTIIEDWATNIDYEQIYKSAIDNVTKSQNIDQASLERIIAGDYLYEDVRNRDAQFFKDLEKELNDVGLEVKLDPVLTDKGWKGVEEEIEARINEKGLNINLNDISDTSKQTQNEFFGLFGSKITSNQDSFLNTLLELKKNYGNEEFTKLIKALSDSSFDFGDVSDWNQLPRLLKKAGTNIPDTELKDFAQDCKNLSQAIEKVNLTTIVDDTNTAFQLLGKVVKGELDAFDVSQEDYEAIINGGLASEEDFRFNRETGNYVYIKGQESLESAIRENTRALQGKANNLYNSEIGFNNLINDTNNRDFFVNSFGGNNTSQRQGINRTIKLANQSGFDLSSLGISGLTNKTDVSILDDATVDSLSDKISEILIKGAEGASLEKENYNATTDYTEEINRGQQQGYTFGAQGISPEEIQAYNDAVDTAFYSMDNYDAKLKDVQEDHQGLINLLGEEDPYWKALTKDIDDARKKTDNLNKVLEKNYETLKDTTSEDYSDAFKELNKSLADIYGSDVFDKGGDFLKENIDDILAYAETGSEETLQKIQQNIAAKQLEAGLGLDTSAAEAEAANLASYLDDWNATITINGYANVQPALNKLATTRAEAEAVARSIEALGNYQVKVIETQPYRKMITLPSTSTKSSMTNGGWGITAADWNKYTIEVPQFIYRVTEGGSVPSGLGGVTPKSSGGGGGGGGGGSNKEPEDNRDWKNPFDELYNSYAELEELQRKRNLLEKEYGLTIDNNGNRIAQTNQYLDDQLKNLRNQLKLEEKIAAKKKDKFTIDEKTKEIKAQGDTYSVEDGVVKSFQAAFEEAVKTSNDNEKNKDVSNDLDKYAKYNTSTQQVEIDWSLIDSLEGTVDAAVGEVLEAYVSHLEELEDQIEETDENILEIKEQVKQVIDQQLENSTNFVDQMRQMMIDEYQKQIDALSTLNEAINDSNSKIFDSIQEQIDLERQIRDNTKKEEDIADNEARLAYLRRDTSGANDLEIQKLEKTLAEQRESYSDQLVDQELSRLQDQADKAAEQRETQISLMEAQLEFWNDTGHWTPLIEALDYEDAKKRWQEYQDFSTKSEVEKIEIMKEFNELWNKGANGTGSKELAIADSMYKDTYYTVSDKNGTAKVHYDKDKQAWVGSLNGKSFELTNDQIAGADINKNTLTLASGVSLPAKEEPAPPPAPTPPPAPQASKVEYYPIPTAAQTNKIKGFNRLSILDSLKAIGVDWNKDRKKIAAANGITNFTGSGEQNKKLRELLWEGKLKKFASGGLVNFTGPAWLDGSNTKPEMILSAKDTQNFIELKDILGSIMKSVSSTSGSSGGDNYFDIKVEVGEIGSDYDVEKMITKIKDEIDQDARYRNVNSINFIR